MNAPLKGRLFPIHLLIPCGNLYTHTHTLCSQGCPQPAVILHRKKLIIARFSLNPAALKTLRSDHASLQRVFKAKCPSDDQSVNLHFSGNLFFIEGFCERKFRTVISGFLFFFFQVMLSRDLGWGRREINPDRSRKKKNKLSDNLSLRNANKICRSRTVASGAPRHRNGTKIYLAICHL